MEREKKDLSFILILLSTLIGTAVLFQWAIVTGLYAPLRNPAMWERLMEKDALFRFLYVILIGGLAFLFPVGKVKDEFEPQGVKVFPISGVTGQGIKELLYYVSNELQHLDQETIVFEQEYFPEEEIPMNDLPYTVEKEDDMYVVEGPKIEKMLGYTNLDSERGFAFFQKFLKDSGILEQLEEAGIQEGDTVRMYGLQFDYYK